MREHLPRFVQRVEQSGGSLPSFVTRELSAFVTCGDFRHGFVVARCRRCAEELRVPFSCKGRGVCPSCIGRRMAEGAALDVTVCRRCAGPMRIVRTVTDPEP